MIQTSEYILDIGDEFYDIDTGRTVYKPEIVGKLIRCRDCKYYKTVTGRCTVRGERAFLIRGENDFCSRGERGKQDDSL